MNAKGTAGERTLSTSGAPTVPAGIAAMDHDALVALVESLFRWALRHTGLTRQQIMAQMRQTDGARLTTHTAECERTRHTRTRKMCHADTTNFQGKNVIL
jgi:hypothetical protein